MTARAPPTRRCESFEAVLKHRGADPFSPVVPLAQLGIARTHAKRGAPDDSRNAYEALFAMWPTADADLPRLRQAREETAAQVAARDLW